MEEETRRRFLYFRECYLRDRFTDVRFHCGGNQNCLEDSDSDSGVLSCHQLILASAFPPLLSLFKCHHLDEEDDRCLDVFLPEFPYSSFRDLVDSVYAAGGGDDAAVMIPPSSIPKELQCWFGQDAFQTQTTHLQFEMIKDEDEEPALDEEEEQEQEEASNEEGEREEALLPRRRHHQKKLNPRVEVSEPCYLERHHRTLPIHS